MNSTSKANTLILLSAIPIAATVACLALVLGITRRTVGMSSFGMVIRDITIRPLEILTTTDPIQNMILAGPPLLFLFVMVLAARKGLKKTSYALSALTVVCWILIVTVSICARAMP